jgi:shikimate kinase
MGAGKTTVGRILAERLGWTFLDLDRQIEERTGRTIPQIFAEQGEERFRYEETCSLENLPLTPPMVIATGGGIIGREGNRRLMRCMGTVIFLDLPWDVLKSRLETESDRPLASGQKDWARVEQLLVARLPLYREADVQLACADLTPEQVAEKVLSEMARCKENCCP